MLCDLLWLVLGRERVASFLVFQLIVVVYISLQKFAFLFGLAF